jgi:hypothetical protein
MSEGADGHDATANDPACRQTVSVPALNRKSRAAQTADPPRLFLEIDVSEFPARCGRTTKQAGYSSTDHGGGKRRCVTLFCHIDCAVACYFGR